MTRRVTAAERRARLAQRHLLTSEHRTDDVAAIADALVALHSSDPVSVYLSAMARMVNPSVEAVERALYDDRSVVRQHAMRRTLWVATPATTRLMHASTNGKLAATERRRTETILAENGIPDASSWLASAMRDVVHLLDAEGPMTSRALGRRIPALAYSLVLAPGKKYQATVGAHTLVLLVLGFEGAIVRTRPTGTWINGEYTWAAAQSWIPGGVLGTDKRAAGAALAEHWLRRFGPGTTADLQWWTGWTANETRLALADADAVEVDLDGVPGWLAVDDVEPVEPPGPWIALLPGLDATTMGWKQRAWYLPAEAADCFDRNGNAGPTIWADGRVVGAWAQRRDGATALHWFSALPAARRAVAAGRAEEMASWVGGARYSVRFPGRVHPLDAAVQPPTEVVP